MMGDYEIIERIKNGDEKAVDELYLKYAPQAVKTVCLMVNDSHSAEDIFQEAFIQCLKSINSLKNPDSFKSWFYRILTRRSWRYINKNKSFVPVEEIYDNKAVSSYDEYFADERYDRLYSAIQGLNKKLKTTIILFYFNEMSIKEIAKAMGCREGTVKSRLFTAKKELRKLINKEEI